MYYIILVTTGQKKTQTAVGGSQLGRSPRFIPESVFCTRSVMLSPRFIPKSVFYTQSVVHSPQSAVRSPQSAVRSPQSTVRSPQSTVRRPQSAVYSPDRVNRHKRCLLRRYARRRAFITKTRTIILFTSKTLNCLGFIYLGEQLQGIFTSETMKRRTC